MEISDVGIKTTILESGEKIVATKTDNPINIDQLKKHKDIIASSEMTVKEFYWHHLESEITFEVVKFLYDECWE